MWEVLQFVKEKGEKERGAVNEAAALKLAKVVPRMLHELASEAEFLL